MPTSGRDTVTSEVLYPDELEGRLLELDGERLNGELAFWDADDHDDREDLPGQGASYGWWVPVMDSADNEPRWAVAPRQLREQLVELELGPGDAFEVTHLEEGESDDDPYEIDLRQYEPGDPT